MVRASRTTWLWLIIATVSAAIWFPALAGAQAHGHPMPPTRSDSGVMQMSDSASPDGDHMMGMADHAMSGGMAMDSVMMLHMELTPSRRATHADSMRALAVVSELRRAIARYGDTSVAVADGFRMFLPGVKNQRVYHFTNYRNAFKEAFRFDPAQPTSLLYKRGSDGKLVLIGAMYTAPKRTDIEKLNDRIPLGIAHWHKHVNWCLPKRGDRERWLDRRDGHPLFGPESPIATKEACDAVGGDFYPTLFGWMVHVNVFEGNDLRSIFADAH